MVKAHEKSRLSFVFCFFFWRGEMCCLGAWPDCKLLFVPKVKSLFLGLIISPKEGCNDLVSRFFFPALFFFYLTSSSGYNSATATHKETGSSSSLITWRSQRHLADHLISIGKMGEILKMFVPLSRKFSMILTIFVWWNFNFVEEISLKIQKIILKIRKNLE